MTTEAKVGVFVIASVLVFGSTTYFVHNTQTGRAQVAYKTRLRYAGGITSGAAVLFGGIKVGQVTAVGPWSEDPTRIEILFAVKSGTPLNQKSTATVGTVTVMTAPALMITTGSNEAGRLSAGDVDPVGRVSQPGRDSRGAFPSLRSRQMPSSSKSGERSRL